MLFSKSENRTLRILSGYLDRTRSCHSVYRFLFSYSVINIQTIATHTIPALSEEIRVLDYCRGIFPQLPSRKSVEKAFKKGLICLNSEPVETGRFVKAGDIIGLIEDPHAPRKTFHLDIEVVYEDAHFAVVNKLAGYPVSGNRFKTIAQALPHNLAQSPEPDALRHALPVHRLDSGTSGLLIVAKTRGAHAALGQLFEARKVRKTYHAIVQGLLPQAGEIEVPIEGLPAHTSYKRMRTERSLRSGWVSLVELSPHSGRTHQIRIHLSGLGYPIVGDKRYSEVGKVLHGKGIFLAATGLSFEHPVEAERMVNLTIPIPPKFDSLLQREAERWKRLGGNQI